MEPSVLIRPALDTDFAAIARVHVDTWRQAYAGIVPQSILDALCYEQSEAFLFASHHQEQPFSTLVAEVEDALVGFAMIGPDRAESTDYAGELRGLYLLSAYQRQGIGRQLMAACSMWLLAHDMPSMRVWVLSDNSASAFYESLGGTRLGQREISLGESVLLETAYGWDDVRSLTADD